MNMFRATFRWTLCLVLSVCAAVVCAAATLGAADESKAKVRQKSPPTTQRATKSQTITIRNSKFSPASLTVKAGGTVTWNNDDDKDHSIVADDQSFKSGNISTDGDFRHTFKKPGTFKYGCRYHPREKGAITVEK